jgi:DNA-binding CsgD family transcriptional regulator
LTLSSRIATSVSGLSDRKLIQGDAQDFVLPSGDPRHHVPVRQEALENRLALAKSPQDFQAFFDLLIQSFGMCFGAVIPTRPGLGPFNAAALVTAGLPLIVERFDQHRSEFLDWVSISGIEEPTHSSFQAIAHDKVLSLPLNALGMSCGLVFAENKRRYVVFLGAASSTISRSDFNEICVTLSRASRCIEWLRLGTPSTVALSTRETEALRWISEGKTSIEAAMITGRSQHTITAHLNSAMRKLDCVTRPQAVAKALRLRLIE